MNLKRNKKNIGAFLRDLQFSQPTTLQKKFGDSS